MRDVHYDDVTAAVEPLGMVARGGFVTDDQGCVVMIGNIGGAMWPYFERERQNVSDPLDVWTRARLIPVAAALGAEFVHPSDQPFQPFQRWAQRADDVWQSPIGLSIHPDHGLWHAYRGALLFPEMVEGLPRTGSRSSPCETCRDQPCLTTCPVEAFTEAGYNSGDCRVHVGSSVSPDCLHDGCAARRACPVALDDRYGPAQMEFHMRAFVGVS